MFIQQPGGTFELVKADELQSDGFSLALAAVDLQHDGLLDSVVANDPLSNELARNVLEERGYRIVRCAPGSSCAWSRTTFVHGSAAWGSFMGAGILSISGGC